MKNIKRFFVYFLFIFVGLVISGCEFSGNEDVENAILSQISKLKFNDLEVTYDGNEYSIYLEGDIPENIEVTYENNYQINAGTYKVTALLKDTKGYCDELPTFEATLTINKADYDMSDVMFNDATYEYDGRSHALEVEGTLPDDVTVSYINNDHINVGEYEVVAVFTHDNPNYNEIPSMSATLTIEAISNFTFTVNESKKTATITGCNGIETDLVIPQYVTYNGVEYKVISIGYEAFKNYGITSIVIPEGVSLIGSSAFYECNKLVNVSLPDGLEIIGDKAFWLCSSLTSITLPESLIRIGNGALRACLLHRMVKPLNTL